MKTTTTHGFNRTSATKSALIFAIMVMLEKFGLIPKQDGVFLDLRCRAILTRMSKSELEEVLRCVIFQRELPASLR